MNNKHDIWNKMLFVLMAALILGTAIGYTATQHYATVDTTGIITSLHLEGVETNPTTIDWGQILVGTSVTRTLQIRCINADGTISFETGNYTAAEQYLTLTWNYTGQVLQPDTWTPVSFTLSVDNSYSGNGDINFSFDLTISATDV